MCEGPARPAVPPVLVAFVAACCTARAVLALGEGCAPWALALTGGLTAFLALSWRRGRLGPRPLFCAAGCLAAACSCAVSLAARTDAVETLSSTPVSSLTLTTVTDASEGVSGWTCRARARTAEGAVGLVWLSTAEPLPIAYEVEGVGRFRPATEEREARARGQGVAGTVSLVHVDRADPAPGVRGCFARLREAVLGRWGPEGSPEHALVAAMACGWRRDLAAFGLDETFSRAGMAHVVAVSGAHLALVAAMLSRVLDQTPLRPAAVSMVTLAVTGAYVLFCAAPLSAVRSWAMTAAAAGSRPVGRRSSPLAATGAVGLAMCLADPTATGDLGFLLSFTSVAALCLFGPLGRAWVRPRARPKRRGRPGPAAKALGGVADGFSAGAVCSVASAPLAASVFSRLSLVGPASSAASGPLFAPLMALGIAALALPGIPLLSPLLEGGACLCAWLLEQVALAASSVPHAVAAATVDEPWATVALVAGACAVYALWPLPTRRHCAIVGTVAVIGALALAVGPWLAPPQVTVLDVGQGDAVLVRDGPRAVLVDCGPPGSGLAEALGRHGVRSLDAVIVTHQHDDHYGGLAELAGTVEVGEVLVAQGAGECLCADLEQAVRSLGCPVAEVAWRDRVSVGGWSLEVLWPRSPVDGDENGESICLLATYEASTNGATALLMGDAEKDVARELEGVGPVDLLKVGHHGSEASLDRACARTLAPTVAVASAGEGNSYGHPDPVCRELLERSGARFLCTMDVGDVTVDAVKDDRGGLRVACSAAELAVA